MLASFDGREIREAELARVFFRDFREQAWAALSRMIGREIAEREAALAGIRVPPDWLARRRVELAAKLEEEAAIAWGIGADVARYTSSRFKQTPEQRLDVLLAHERERHLFSRVIRFQALRTDQAELDMIVVEDAALAAEIASNLDAGADFARLAERHSVHDSGEHGGRLPPLPAEALQPAVASRVFELEPGQRTGVLQVDDGSGSRQYEILRLVRLIPGRDVTWEAAREEIEAGLAERPVDLFEWTAWFLVLERLYKVTLSDNV